MESSGKMASWSREIKSLRWVHTPSRDFRLVISALPVPLPIFSSQLLAVKRNGSCKETLQNCFIFSLSLSTQVLSLLFVSLFFFLHVCERKNTFSLLAANPQKTMISCYTRACWKFGSHASQPMRDCVCMCYFQGRYLCSLSFMRSRVKRSRQSFCLVCDHATALIWRQLL